MGSDVNHESLFRLESDSDNGGASSCHGQGPVRCKTLSCALPDLKNPWARQVLPLSEETMGFQKSCTVYVPTDYSLMHINIETVSEGFLTAIMCGLPDTCWAVAYVL